MTADSRHPDDMRRAQLDRAARERLYLDRPFDFSEDANWRIFRIMAEFVEGFEFLYPLRREVTFFGGAALPESSPWYEEARRLGRLLGEAGYTVITGGGPGIMEAGNRGSYEAGGESIGLNIELPMEQRRNPYVKRGVGFHYFFTRKVMMSASAQAYVFFPGGFGTLDEFFELSTLVQTEKMEKVPIICVGQEYWGPLDDWIRGCLLHKFKTIAPQDVDIYTLVDTAEEALKLIKQSKERKYF
ncbi:MAG: TIGR00730 family Rossman fold protein [Candidatus Andersenbacteria bacterium CG10_big_fil_rev_8_21_14_0_10_54_11]|uniref:Cytokinin riboside 5'-monophosphate phosphoribohydrolase n=1 Tax=Candidatus Andersenbacteria bacterium CG10_big_fil_rev_8_21_14_0_10_54_11 TaxID=1974485 RepID=A0A2M6WYF3_9BACT|nr:MAG: TIGR00730 family Rossman fold protein [Candidatus Andersenbacteria bacterium CG10_big_fil_rev_8_21_14_0_10_54_11]